MTNDETASTGSTILLLASPRWRRSKCVAMDDGLGFISRLRSYGYNSEPHTV